MRFIVTLMLVAMVSPTLAAQPQSFSIPQDTVNTYFSTIVVPALSGNRPAEKDLLQFYRGFVSIHSQAQVAEDQFVPYWQGVANRTFGSEFLKALFLGLLWTRLHVDYVLGEPVYNDARDQARFSVKVSMRSAFTSDYRIIPAHLAKEDGVWKLVIADDMAKEMQKLPTKQVATASTRHTVMRETSVKGIRFSVATVTLEKDMTVLDVTVENASDQHADLTFAISAATLTDETGTVYTSRVLRSSLEGSLGPKRTVRGTLAFMPIAAASRRVSLSFPDVRLGDESLSLSFEIAIQ